MARRRNPANGRVKMRSYADGRVAYTAYFNDPVAPPKNGRKPERNAGTWDTWQEADDAWREKERAFREGRYQDPRKGRTPLCDFVTATWLPSRVISEGTLDRRWSDIRSIYNFFGPTLPLGDITYEACLGYIQHLRSRLLSESTVRSRRIQLNSILQMGVDAGYIAVNPCAKVVVPLPPVDDDEDKAICMEPEEALAMQDWLNPYPQARLLADIGLETGVRWGENTEMRVGDVKEPKDGKAAYLWVRRAVYSVGHGARADNGRYMVGPTKGKTKRKVSIDEELYGRIRQHIDEHDLSDDDLLFTQERMAAEVIKPKVTLADMPAGIPPLVKEQKFAWKPYRVVMTKATDEQSDEWRGRLTFAKSNAQVWILTCFRHGEQTAYPARDRARKVNDSKTFCHACQQETEPPSEPELKQFVYEHGTLRCNNAGCKCQWCLLAHNEHRRAMEQAGLWKRSKRVRKTDMPYVFGRNTTGHVGYGWFKTHLWKPMREAIEMTDLGIHDLRHTYATWQLDNGTPQHLVQFALGHKSSVTTDRYTRKRDSNQDRPLEAMRKAKELMRGTDVGNLATVTMLPTATAAPAAMTMEQIAAQMAALNAQMMALVQQQSA